MNYRKYLASREWGLLNKRIHERSKGRCERCFYGRHEQTHHLSYERLGRETLDDLIGVCEPCHLYLSGKSEVDPILDIQKFYEAGEDLNRRRKEAQAVADRLFTEYIEYYTKEGEIVEDLTNRSMISPDEKTIQALRALGLEVSLAPDGSVLSIRGRNVRDSFGETVQ